MEYSAVSHPPAPGPFAFSQGGRSFSIMAVHRTRVFPKLTSTEPPAKRVNCLWNESGRGWSGARPSCRRNAADLLTARGVDSVRELLSDDLFRGMRNVPCNAIGVAGFDAIELGDGNSMCGWRWRQSEQRRLRGSAVPARTNRAR